MFCSYFLGYILSQTLTCCSDTATQYLNEILLRYQTWLELCLNNTDRLTVPYTRKTIGDQAFATCASVLWNTLSAAV